MSISDTFTPVKPRSLLFTWKLIPHTAFITFHHIYNLSPKFRRKEKNVLCPQSECIAFGLIAEQLSWQTYRCTLYGPKTFRCVFRETNRKGNEIFQDWNELEQSAPGWSSPQLFSSRWHTHIFLFLLSEAKDIKMCTKTTLLLLSYLVSQDAFFRGKRCIKCARKQGFHFSSCYFSSNCRTHCMVSVLAACSLRIWSCRRNHRSFSDPFSCQLPWYISMIFRYIITYPLSLRWNISFWVIFPF